MNTKIIFAFLSCLVIFQLFTVHNPFFSLTGSVNFNSSFTSDSITVKDSILGFSTNNYPIECYSFGKGLKQVVLIGGTHGGYEWNTILLAYAMIEHFSVKTRDVPASVTLHIIPCANPDGLVAVVGRPGRFTAKDIPKNTKSGRVNGNNVDLNRNWDCRWDSTAFWRKKKISGGTAPFSEIETIILKTFLFQLNPHCVVFLHSQYPGVFPGKCDSLDQKSLQLAEVYSEASGYPLIINFEEYPVTGDASNWLSGQGIPAFHVELTDHRQIELQQNLKAVSAIMDFISEMK